MIRMKRLLTFVIVTSTGSLRCMESSFAKIVSQSSPASADRPADKKPSPITFAQIYYYFSHDLELVRDITQQIFLLHLKFVNLKKFLQDISQARESDVWLVEFTRKLTDACGYQLASELCAPLFAHAKISLYRIQDDPDKKNALFYAITRCDPEVAHIFAKITGDDVLKLLTQRIDTKNNTILHHTVFAQNKRTAKLTLDLAGDKAYTLLAIKNNLAHTAFDCASPKIQKIMQEYMQKNQQK